MLHVSTDRSLPSRRRVWYNFTYVRGQYDLCFSGTLEKFQIFICFSVVELGLILDMPGKYFSSIPIFAANAAANNETVFSIVSTPTLGACNIAMACNQRPRGVPWYCFLLNDYLMLLTNTLCCSNTFNIFFDTGV